MSLNAKQKYFSCKHYQLEIKYSNKKTKNYAMVFITLKESKQKQPIKVKHLDKTVSLYSGRV
jgi:hypothetical protein